MANYYDFSEIETPIFENSDLFKKPLGEHSDVVLKEMYTFEDRNQSFLTLRPEYTTPMIRAAISNSLLSNLPVKLYGFGPIFRRERPQKGRYRQFNQINFEILGAAESSADAELILLAYEFLNRIKLSDKVTLHINSLGEKATILKYKNILSDYYEKYHKDLSDESKIKINDNPLRILDSKNVNDKKINQNAPKIKDYCSKNALLIFDQIQSILNDRGIKYSVNNNLVRGLDYYCHTVFEFKIKELGSQETIIGGGRYDGLVRTIGGKDIPGVGWASGVERIMMCINKIEIDKNIAQIITVDENSKHIALKLLVELRNHNIKIKYDYKTNIKKSLKNANQEGISYAIIIGDTEVQNNNFTLKDLKKNQQEVVSYEKILNILKNE